MDNLRGCAINFFRTRRVPLLLMGLGLFLAACSGGRTPPTVVFGLDRSDPSAVSEAAFDAILEKDYQELRQLRGCGVAIPDAQPWANAAFIRDRTVNEGIKQLWIMGNTGGYTVNEVTMEDFQAPRFLAEKLVQVRFSLAGKSYVATFPITLCNSQWSPGMLPTRGDFFIRFEEP